MRRLWRHPRRARSRPALLKDRNLGEVTKDVVSTILRSRFRHGAGRLLPRSFRPGTPEGDAESPDDHFAIRERCRSKNHDEVVDDRWSPQSRSMRTLPHRSGRAVSTSTTAGHEMSSTWRAPVPWAIWAHGGLSTNAADIQLLAVFSVKQPL